MRATHTNANMSHQNRIAYKLTMFLDSLKSNGVAPTIKKIKQQIYLKKKGIDFSTQNIYDLTRTGEYKDHGTALVSTSEDFLNQLITDLEDIIEKPVNKELFIDYGSGKGAAIIHAKRLGFQETIGVEFAKELHEIAEENIAKLHLKDVSSLYADATTYTPPNNVSVIYFFNPFDKIVMEKVIDNLLLHKKNFNHDVYVIYGNFSCTILREKLNFLKNINYKSGANADFYKI